MSFESFARAYGPSPFRIASVVYLTSNRNQSPPKALRSCEWRWGDSNPRLCCRSLRHCTIIPHFYLSRSHVQRTTFLGTAVQRIGKELASLVLFPALRTGNIVKFEILLQSVKRSITFLCDFHNPLRLIVTIGHGTTQGNVTMKPSFYAIHSSRRKSALAWQL